MVDDTWEYIDAAGVSFDLSAEPYQVVDFNRLGAPPVSFTTSQAASGGLVVGGAVYGEQRRQVFVRVSGDTPEETIANTEALMGALRVRTAMRDPAIGQLVHHRYDGTTRWTPAVLQSGLELTGAYWRSPLLYHVRLVFLTPHPYWASLTTEQTPYVGIGVEDHDPPFPAEFPLAFGSLRPSANVDIDYDGSADTDAVLITLSNDPLVGGALPLDYFDNPRITHAESGESIGLEYRVVEGQYIAIYSGGDPIDPGRVFDIVLMPSEESLIQYATEDSVPIVLHPGANVLRCDLYEGSANVSISYTPQYLSGA